MKSAPLIESLPQSERTNDKLSVNKDNRLTHIISVVIIIASLLISSCANSSPATASPTADLSTPTRTSIPATATPIPTATLAMPEPPYLTWVDPSLPLHISMAVENAEYLATTEDEGNAQITISQDPGLEAGSWLFVAAAPFYSFAEEIQSADLSACWTSGWTEAMPFRSILVSEDTLASISLLWGPPSQECVRSLDPADLTQIIWLERDAIALLPFSQLEPAYKVLSVDGEDPLSKAFNRDEYPLILRFNYQVSPGYQIALDQTQYITNFDPSKLTVIALTGVTALVRDTASIMEEQGVLYPAGDIQEILLNADITHISNEVPFAVDCPVPDASQVSLRFCSNDRYLELLEAVGTDIVELSGDHFGDRGPEAMLHTIDLYLEQGWEIYGGGKTLSEGLAPAFLSHNGNQFAFIGCNGKGIAGYATATDDNPGAAQCDFTWMVPEITRLTNEGYIVIATMQHEEVDSFGSIALQRNDFRKLADAGAAIVSGSQAHHPQAIEYTGSSFIHYGLGNLFFDQWFLAHYNPKQHINKDKAFIDLHYFYDGEHLGTRLIPLQFIDNARPRPMTSEESIPFLNEFYEYSLWNGDWINLYSTGYMSDRMDQ